MGGKLRPRVEKGLVQGPRASDSMVMMMMDYFT